jgi:hypothetical protein
LNWVIGNRLPDGLLGVEATTLQTWMNPCGCGIPQLPVGLDECLDLDRREVDALIAQSAECLERLSDEPKAQLFVGDYLADEQLNRFLRHGP